MANILLVDHGIELVEPLQAAGHNVTTAADGKFALEKLSENRYDLIITELFLPEVDGFEILRWTETQPPPVPPVIAITEGHPNMPQDIALLLAKAQATHTLARPFAMDDLLCAVSNALSQAAAVEQ